MDAFAWDAKFVTATKQETAEALCMDLDDMEGLATDILNGRRGRVVKRQRRPIPSPPSNGQAKTQDLNMGSSNL